MMQNSSLASEHFETKKLKIKPLMIKMVVGDRQYVGLSSLQSLSLTAKNRLLKIT